MTACVAIPTHFLRISRKCYENPPFRYKFKQSVEAGLRDITEIGRVWRSYFRSMKSIVSILTILVWSLTSPAFGATTEFAVSVFSTSGPVTNPNNALGAADGSGAIIGNGGEIVLQFDEWLAAESIDLAVTFNGIAAGGTIAIGHVVNGVAVFSPTQNFNVVVGNALPASFDFSAQCAAISANGCNLLQIQTTGTVFSSGISLDGVVGSAPEPATWMMMILGFIGIAFRLKQVKATGQSRLQGSRALTAFSPA